MSATHPVAEYDQAKPECRGKKVYPGWHSASEVLKKRKRHVRGIQLYRCKKCQGWHIGRSGDFIR